MKRVLILGVFWSAVLVSFGQSVSTLSDTGYAQNSSTRILGSTNQSRVTLGGYAQLDYNQPFNNNVIQNGNLDVHRLVLLFGYKFSKQVSFVTEVEFEHVQEVYIEQAFLNYNVDPRLNFRAGLMLVPMGIINEYHEPPTFNGVERPNLDKYVVPSTWRELGAGINGRFQSASLSYQLYVFNGFLGQSADGATFRGSDGYRKGRQKGIESVINSPNLSAKLDYYGILGLKLGLSGYVGKSQSTLFDGVDPNNEAQMLRVDSSVISIAMVGLDARYQKKGFEARGQFIYASNQNTQAYNIHGNTDLGSALMGYYVEAGYNVLRFFKLKTTKKLVAFARYEEYDTHHKTTQELPQNKAYHRMELTTGLSFHISPGAVVKADYQLWRNKENTSQTNMFNAGVGWWF